MYAAPAVQPEPSWVRKLELPQSTAAPLPDAGGTEWLLRDSQTRESSITERYSRRALRITSTSGVQNWREIQIDFDPSWQRLVLHHVRVHRGDATIDALRSDEVRIIQREADLAQRIYDGRMTALLFLHDLRPGDVIDYAWSINGSNPVLGGRFVDWAALGSDAATGLIHWRLLHPVARAIRTSVFDSSARLEESRRADGLVEKRIELTAVEPLEFEEQMPAWLDSWPRVQSTEFSTWAEVAQWADELFGRALAEGDHELLDDLAIQLAASSESPESRATAAIRFVQDEIRYLGIEAGSNSHQPHAPELVLSRRFGDCKDKALLLVELLHRLGLEAHVALVDSTGGRELARQLPSPFLFDHAIVAIRHGDQMVWVDATVSDTGGSLATMAPPALDQALLVDGSTQGLTGIDVRPEGSVRIAERWNLSGERALFAVESLYTGAEADEIRSMLSATSLADLARRYREYYAQADPDIEADGPPVIEDSRDENVIVVRENYRLSRFWTEARERELWAHGIAPAIVVPSSTRRTHPLALTGRSRLEHEIEIVGGRNISFPPRQMTIENAAFRLQSRAWRERDRVRFRCVWEPLTDVVSPAEIPRYASAVRQAEEALSLTISRSDFPLLASAALFPRLPAFLAGGAAVACGALGLVGLVVGRKRRSPGAGVARVRRVSEVGDLPVATHCGVNGIPVSGSGRTVGSDASGAPLVRLAVVCPECLRSRPVVVVVAGESVGENLQPTSSVQ